MNYVLENLRERELQVNVILSSYHGGLQDPDYPMLRAGPNRPPLFQELGTVKRSLFPLLVSKILANKSHMMSLYLQIQQDWIPPTKPRTGKYIATSPS